ncbi:MAG: chromosome segregation protein SMC [Acidobacteriia bacterium]|nr:chromosome segregation protein SMC [Terriglobia bacterium]
MLRLKRLELHGFKSFCDRTELRFNGGGIAAIVGPNGCGKSNLSDAISWVLGEQSAKSLRGTRMEDVIFNGTRDRKATGMAAVTMTLVDPTGQHQHPTTGTRHPENEITITRRLFRSGESEYLIDGHAARLRDIQDLFMGTGLGPESYAIIEQGRIGQILSSRPQDRRAVMEEAAGISKFKTRKRLAEAKLESARQNLARVFDILEEVTRQLNSLKRQASKTRRYGELKGEMDAKLRLVLAARFQQLEREAAKAALDLNLASNELRTLSEDVTANEQERERLQNSLFDTESRLTGLRSQLAALQVEAERTRGRLEAQVRETGAIEERITQGEREVQELETRSGELAAERDTHGAAVDKFDRQISGARERMLQKNEARESLQTRLADQEKSIEDGRMVVLRLMGEISTIQNQLAQIDEYLAGIERETARAQKEEQSAAAEIERLAAARKQLSETMVRRQMDLEAVSGERRHTEEELGAQKAAAAELRAQIDTVRSDCSHLAARKTSLQDILSHRAYSTEPVKRLFGATDADVFKPLGLLADFVEVDPAYERAAEEFLHDELEYVVVEDWGQAEQGMSVLRGGSEGRATFLVHNGASVQPAQAESVASLPRLTDYLRLTNGLAHRALDLLPRLANCRIAQDHAEAQRLAEENPDFYFLLPDGLCYHGRTLSGGKKAAGGPLVMKRELRELTGTLAVRERELEEQVARADALEREIGLLESELERLRTLQQAGEKDSLALDHEMRKLSEETARSNARVSVARLDLERLRRESERSIEQRDANRQAVSEKETQRTGREQELTALSEEMETLEAEAAHLAEEHAALRVELAGLEERHRAERASMARVEGQLAEVNGRREELTREIERLGIERARLLADNIELDRKSAALTGEMQTAEAEVNRLAFEESQLREMLAETEEKLKTLRVEVETAHHKRSEIEVELVRKQGDLKYLDETSRKELNTPVAELMPGEEALPDGEALAEVERQYDEIRARIEALGPINPQALEEFQECQQRHEFLSVQRQDLIDSIRDTERAIQEIDEVSRQKFAEAFEAINANFREAFLTLFGGGSGEMRLTDETNIAESGIDIVASPPGKKLQNVLLLSGGEKALAALALLMAIFRYQPSPFCILDEVDAPLDESNIGRLMRLLREMSAGTQFVIITHSKKTMESAQAMYGVTMQEPGVSRLVSVKFEGVAASVAAAPAA